MKYQNIIAVNLRLMINTDIHWITIIISDPAYLIQIHKKWVI